MSYEGDISRWLLHAWTSEAASDRSLSEKELASRIFAQRRSTPQLTRAYENLDATFTIEDIPDVCLAIASCEPPHPTNGRELFRIRSEIILSLVDQSRSQPEIIPSIRTIRRLIEILDDEILRIEAGDTFLTSLSSLRTSLGSESVRPLYEKAKSEALLLHPIFRAEGVQMVIARYRSISDSDETSRKAIRDFLRLVQTAQQLSQGHEDGCK